MAAGEYDQVGRVSLAGAAALELFSKVRESLPSRTRAIRALLSVEAKLALRCSRTTRANGYQVVGTGPGRKAGRLNVLVFSKLVSGALLSSGCCVHFHDRAFT